MWKKVALSAAAITTLAGATYGMGQSNLVFASQGGPLAGQETLVRRLVEKFGLNESEVQQVFQEHHSEMRAKHQARMEERLKQAVEDGVITAEQFEAIQAKHQELKEQHEAMQENWETLSADERQSLKQQHREDMRAWAEASGIEFNMLKMKGAGSNHSRLQ